MTIKEAQELVDRWIKEYGVRYFSELTNMTVLTEEVGELARIIARRYGDQSWKAEDPRGEDNGKQALGEESRDPRHLGRCPLEDDLAQGTNTRLDDFVPVLLRQIRHGEYPRRLGLGGGSRFYYRQCVRERVFRESERGLYFQRALAQAYRVRHQQDYERTRDA